LSSFRKVIGYDTFDSIRKGNRDETKNPDDYYNITYNILVKRNPSKTFAFENPMNEYNHTLKDLLDKGFPYDDLDTYHGEYAPEKKPSKKGKLLGKLNGGNVTSGALKNLVKDKTAPVTKKLAQLEKSNKDGLFQLMGSNVTRGAMKNLVTDTPAPITVALA
jgi:hypothetical protein